MILLRGFLGLVILSLLGLALAAPSAFSQVPLLLAAVSSAFGAICHQEPSRALLVDGLPSLLCARCLGTFAGGGAAFLLPAGLSRRFVLALLTTGAAAWLVEAASRPWPAEARLLAGITIGLGLAAPVAEACRPRILC